MVSCVPLLQQCDATGVQLCVFLISQEEDECVVDGLPTAEHGEEAPSLQGQKGAAGPDLAAGRWGVQGHLA